MEISLVNDDIPLYFLKKCMDCTMIGVDIETSGLDPIKDQIACVQIYADHVNSPECLILRRLASTVENLNILMSKTNVIKIFHHAPFDLEFLMRDYKVMRPRKIACTKLMAKLIDPHRTKFYDPNKQRAGHSLAALVYTLFGKKLDKSLAVSNWFADELKQEQIQYAVNDIKYLPELYIQLLKTLIEENKFENYDDTVKALPATLACKLRYGIKDLYGYN